MLAEIAPPDRRKGEADFDWNERRYDYFREHLLAHLMQARPHLLVIEITSHAHTSYTRDGVFRKTSGGQEFRAGLGLGHALGWIDAIKLGARAYGCAALQVAAIEANDAKLRVTGNRTASKAIVQAKLLELFGWRTDGWRESQVDALAAGLGYLRQAAMVAAEAQVRRRAVTDAPALKARRVPHRRPLY